MTDAGLSITKGDSYNFCTLTSHFEGVKTFDSKTNEMENYPNWKTLFKGGKTKYVCSGSTKI